MGCGLVVLVVCACGGQLVSRLRGVAWLFALAVVVYFVCGLLICEVSVLNLLSCVVVVVMLVWFGWCLVWFYSFQVFVTLCFLFGCYFFWLLWVCVYGLVAYLRYGCFRVALLVGFVVFA